MSTPDSATSTVPAPFAAPTPAAAPAQPLGPNVAAMFDSNVAAAAAALAAPPQPPQPEPAPAPLLTLTNTPPPAAVPSPGTGAPRPPANPHGFLGVMHRDLDMVGSAISHAWPFMRRLATSPRLDALVEAALRAEDAGVAAEVFQTLVDALDGATARTQSQPPQGTQTVAAGASGGSPAAAFPAQGDPNATQAMELGSLSGEQGTAPQ